MRKQRDEGKKRHMMKFASKHRMQRRRGKEAEREVERIEGGIGSRVSERRKMHIYACC